MSVYIARRTVRLYGTVVRHPVLRVIPSREVEDWVYLDPIDEVVSRPAVLPEMELRTFWLALPYTDPETGKAQVRRKLCEDWRGLCRDSKVCPHDEVRATGSFEEYSVEGEDGELVSRRASFCSTSA
jgi:hypothetical protein